MRGINADNQSDWAVHRQKADETAAAVTPEGRAWPKWFWGPPLRFPRDGDEAELPENDSRRRPLQPDGCFKHFVFCWFGCQS
jgi:hypothetical protein